MKKREQNKGSNTFYIRQREQQGAPRKKIIYTKDREGNRVQSNRELKSTIRKLAINYAKESGDREQKQARFFINYSSTENWRKKEEEIRKVFIQKKKKEN